MLYKERHERLRDIAEELDVEWILLASMIHAGEEARITTQLVDAGADENRWAQSYTKPSRNPLGAQSEIATAVAQQVSCVLAQSSTNNIAGCASALAGSLMTEAQTMPNGR